MTSASFSLPFAAIFPSTMKRSPTSSRLFAGSMIRPLRMMIALIVSSVFRSCCDPSAEIEDGHPHGETVGDLFENDALGAVREFAVDLDAAIDRTRMHDQT